MWEKMRVDGVRKLKANAVPTIFTFKKEEKVPKERKPPKNRSPPTNSSPEHLTSRLSVIINFFSRKYTKFLVGK